MSTSSRDNRVIASITKPRRSPPGDVQGSVFFTGQGGRTVLPPLSSAFPTSRFPVPNTYTTPYTQPRSSSGRYELSPQAFNCAPWPSNTSPQLSSAYPNYETTERYSTLSNYTTTAYPSRTSSPVGTSPDSPGESRRLPPIPGTTSVDRWPQNAYIATQPNYSTARSSNAVYPSVYPPYTASNSTASYSYSIPPHDHNSQPLPQLATLTPNPHTTHAAVYGESETQRPEARPASPYGGGTSPPQTNLTTAPTGQSTSTEEPTIKKKRKRADATQLKALNETYNRTAFPSTEERLHLAKILDMSPRSVQIWFQNKRQSMRQTSRQSSSASSTAHHSFPVVPPADAIMDEMNNSPSAYNNTVTITDMSFLTAAPQDASRTHNRITHSPHYRPEEYRNRPRAY